MAWRFDGTTSSNIETGAATTLSANEGFVCGCMFRTFRTNYTGTTFGIIMGSNNPGTDNQPWELAVGNADNGTTGSDNGGFLYRRYVSVSHWANAPAGSIADRRWHSVVGGRTAAGTPYICVDGGAVNTSPGVSRTNAASLTNNVFIGDRQNGGSFPVPVEGDVANAFHFRGPDLAAKDVQAIGRYIMHNVMRVPNRWITTKIADSSGIWYRGGLNKAIDTSGYGNHGDVNSAFRIADPPFYGRRSSVVHVETAAAGFVPYPYPRGARAGMGELVGGMH